MSSSSVASWSSTSSEAEVETDPSKIPYTGAYDYILAGDFATRSVFVHIDVFAKTVLHVPSNWKENWGSTIREVKSDPTFSAAFKNYQDAAPETRSFMPLVKMANVVFRVAESSANESVKPLTKVRYFTNDPKRIDGGVITYGQSPNFIRSFSLAWALK
jgi:hypothetical protein